jgi:hypothetical protein
MDNMMPFVRTGRRLGNNSGVVGGLRAACAHPTINFFTVRATADLCILKRLWRIGRYMSEDFKVSRERMIELLNEDLSRELLLATAAEAWR